MAEQKNKKNIATGFSMLIAGNGVGGLILLTAGFLGMGSEFTFWFLLGGGILIVAAVALIILMQITKHKFPDL